MDEQRRLGGEATNTARSTSDRMRACDATSCFTHRTPGRNASASPTLELRPDSAVTKNSVERFQHVLDPFPPYACMGARKELMQDRSTRGSVGTAPSQSMEYGPTDAGEGT